MIAPRSTLLVALALTTLASAARAAPEPGQPRGKKAAVEAKAGKNKGKTKLPADGRVEFERAMALFQAGDYAAARPLFEQAYALSGRRATTIRALAQCERALGDHPRAIALFREYLATQPPPADAPQIEQTIADLERAQAAAAPPVAAPPPALDVGAPPATPPAAPPPELITTAVPAAETRWAPVVAVAASALVTAGGATLFILGKSDASTVESAAPGTPFTDVRDAADRAPALMTAGTVAAGVGVAALAASVVWLLSPE